MSASADGHHCMVLSSSIEPKICSRNVGTQRVLSVGSVP